jgi:hypothetical protein
MGRMSELDAEVRVAERIKAEPKTSLTPDEKLRAAYAHLINGVDQHHIASLFGVNSGRVNEAIMDVRKAIYGVKK